MHFSKDSTKHKLFFLLRSTTIIIARMNVPHILKSIHPNAKDFDVEEAVDTCFAWVIHEFAPMNCMRPPGLSNRSTSCACMKFLSEPGRTDEAKKVTEYMVHFSGLKLETRRELINEWAKVSSLLESMDEEGNKKHVCYQH